MNITITKTTHPGTLPPSDRLGFGTVFTDHMFLMDLPMQSCCRWCFVNMEAVLTKSSTTWLLLPEVLIKTFRIMRQQNFLSRQLKK